MNLENILLEKMEQLKKSQKFLHTKIAKFYDVPILSEKDRKKKNIELNFLGKFIECYNQKIIITESRESPDFAILLDGKTFGIEIKELEFNDKRRKGVLDKMFKEINKELKIVSAIFQGTYKITFRDKNLQFPKNIEQKVKEEILTLIKTNATEYNGEFIEKIYKTKTNSGNVHVHESALGICPILSKGTIIKNINKKESLMPSYQKNGFEKNWLLLTSDGIKDDFTDVYRNPLDPYTSSFEKIFILNCSSKSYIDLPLTKLKP